MTSADRSNPSDITGIYVRSADGQMLPLDSLVQVDETVAPRELNHFGQRRAVTISASLGPELAMGDAVAKLEEVAARILPGGYAVDYDGQTSYNFV